MALWFLKYQACFLVVLRLSCLRPNIFFVVDHFLLLLPTNIVQHFCMVIHAKILWCVILLCYPLIKDNVRYALCCVWPVHIQASGSLGFVRMLSRTCATSCSSCFGCKCYHWKKPNDEGDLQSIVTSTQFILSLVLVLATLIIFADAGPCRYLFSVWTSYIDTAGMARFCPPSGMYVILLNFVKLFACISMCMHICE